MSGQGKGKSSTDHCKEEKEVEDLKKARASSGHTTPAKPKWPYSEV